MRLTFCFLGYFVFSAGLLAEVKTETLTYKDGDTILEGFLAYDTLSSKKRPVIFIVHEWKGLDDYAKIRAVQLAERGYLAMAVDIYGEGLDQAPKPKGL